VTPRYRSPHDLLSSLKELLVSKPAANAEDALEEVVEALHQARGYFWIGIYLAAGDKVIRQCFRGPVPCCHSFVIGVSNVGTTAQSGNLKVIPAVSADPTYHMCFPETKSEIVLPIKIASRILGVIDVESDRLNAFSNQERILLEQVAEMLARYLTTNQGKLLSRKVREKSHTAEAETQPQKRPQPARPEKRRAAAGERSGK
jgi:L-methionine (R)-S-oxide reductase